MNSDLLNLLANVQIAVVMVSSDLKIRRFTPMAERTLNLIPSDVGRPISDIKPNIDCPDLVEMISEAIDSVTTRERSVSDRYGRRYALRIRPYKSVENRIDGAVVALFEAHEGLAAAAEATAVEQVAREMAEVSFEPVLVLGQDMRIRAANQAFGRAFDLPINTLPGRTLHELDGRAWNSPVINELFKRACDGDKVEGVELSQEFPRVGKKTVRVNVRCNNGGTPQSSLVLMAFQEHSGQH